MDAGHLTSCRFTALLDELHVPSQLHLYIDTRNSPASAVFDIIHKVAGEVGVSEACCCLPAGLRGEGPHAYPQESGP